MEFTAELAKYGPTGVALALVGFITYVGVRMLAFFERNEQRHDKSDDRFAKAIRQNTKVTEQTYRFMKNLNGKLEGAVKEKAKE